MNQLIFAQTRFQMRILSLLVLLTVLFSFTSDYRKVYPQDYFNSPVNQRLLLSGTFGELRPNHFHAGIDIKGKVGVPIVSAAEGYVSRIKIQSGGYGNVLYINHPNGYTTVYAHLKNFTPDLEAYVKKAQLKRKSFEIELFPSAGQFAFKKGQQIGKMGVSGRSFGPHLHFEVRDTKSEKPINPLLFGFKVTDNIAPKLHQLKAYYLNDKLETLNTKTFNLKKKKKGYYIVGDTLEFGAWRVGLGLKAYDHMNGTPNWNGVYSIQMKTDDQLAYDFTMETFAFSESRFINAHLDYEEQVAHKSYFNRCYRLPGNRLSVYEEGDSKGIIGLKSGKATKITMFVNDAAGNRSTLEFWAKRREVESHKESTYNYFLPFNEENRIETSSFYLNIPKGALYQNLYLRYRTSRDDSDNVFSSVHHVHDYKTPVHRYFELGIQPTKLPLEWKDKAVIAYCNKNHKMQTCGGAWKGGKLVAKVRALGDYSIMVDREPPRIVPISYKSNMRGFTKMTFKITDNFETTGKAKDLRYRATLDGQWILFKYDAKKDLLTHRFDKNLPAGKHTLKLVVTDDRNNETILERTFTR